MNPAFIDWSVETEYIDSAYNPEPSPRVLKPPDNQEMSSLSSMLDTTLWSTKHNLRLNIIGEARSLSFCSSRR